MIVRFLQGKLHDGAGTRLKRKHGWLRGLVGLK